MIVHTVVVTDWPIGLLYHNIYNYEYGRLWYTWLQGNNYSEQLMSAVLASGRVSMLSGP